MVGIMDTPQTGDLNADVRTREHTELARRLSEHSTVLLKNDRGILPIVWPPRLPSTNVLKLIRWATQDATRLRTIAVIGDDANDNPVFRGEGSGEVSAEYVVTPLEVLPHRSMPCRLPVVTISLGECRASRLIWLAVGCRLM